MVALILVLTILAAAGARAQSNTAYDSASCEASFLKFCLNQETITSSDVGVAAPMPVVGLALWECSMLLVGLGGVWFARRQGGRGQANDEG